MFLPLSSAEIILSFVRKASSRSDAPLVVIKVREKDDAAGILNGQHHGLNLHLSVHDLVAPSHQGNLPCLNDFPTVGVLSAAMGNQNKILLI